MNQQVKIFQTGKQDNEQAESNISSIDSNKSSELKKGINS